MSLRDDLLSNVVIQSLSGGFASMVGAPQSRGVSPLAQLLWKLNDEGLAFSEMERIADRQGFKISTSTISDIANDKRDRLTSKMIEALSKASGIEPAVIAALDDERFGLNRDYVARAASTQDEGVDLGVVPTDELLAEIARRAGASNPDRKR